MQCRRRGKAAALDDCKLYCRERERMKEEQANGEDKLDLIREQQCFTRPSSGRAVVLLGGRRRRMHFFLLCICYVGGHREQDSKLNAEMLRRPGLDSRGRIQWNDEIFPEGIK